MIFTLAAIVSENSIHAVGSRMVDGNGPAHGPVGPRQPSSHAVESQTRGLLPRPARAQGQSRLRHEGLRLLTLPPLAEDQSGDALPKGDTLCR